MTNQVTPEERVIIIQTARSPELRRLQGLQQLRGSFQPQEQQQAPLATLPDAAAPTRSDAKVAAGLSAGEMGGSTDACYTTGESVLASVRRLRVDGEGLAGPEGSEAASSNCLPAAKAKHEAAVAMAAVAMAAVAASGAGSGRPLTARQPPQGQMYFAFALSGHATTALGGGSPPEASSTLVAELTPQLLQGATHAAACAGADPSACSGDETAGLQAARAGISRSSSQGTSAGASNAGERRGHDSGSEDDLDRPTANELIDAVREWRRGGEWHCGGGEHGGAMSSSRESGDADPDCGHDGLQPLEELAATGEQVPVLAPAANQLWGPRRTCVL